MMRDVYICDAHTALRRAENAVALSHTLEMTPNGSAVRILPLPIYERLLRILWRECCRLVEVFHRGVGEPLLYLTECAGLWFLYGRTAPGVGDKALLWGAMDADDLTRLAARLREGMGGAI